ncbi:MAG: response regulator [Pseudomonadota bacterium]
MTLSIMIVDDNAADRYLLKRRLQKTDLDFDVIEAENGAAALEVFSDYQTKRDVDPETYPPLFVFLDINMPILDGFGFLSAFHHVSAAPDFAPPTVVMFTSSGRQEDKDRSLHWDFVKEYIVKGDFSSAKLKELLQAHVSTFEAA